MRDIIYNILVSYYGRMYGYDFCVAMTDWIAERINNGEYKTRGDVYNYLLWNTSGGGVAEVASEDIQQALSGVLTDSMARTRG